MLLWDDGTVVTLLVIGMHCFLDLHISYFVYTATCYNFTYGCFQLKQFNDNDLNLAHIIRFYCVVFGIPSPHEASDISTS